MKILYFGPITPEGKPSIGGYEAANRKNIDALRKRGVEVVEFPNPRINHHYGTLGKLAYIKLYYSALKLWKFRKEKGVILHITPLYRTLLVYPAVFTEWMAKKLYIPVLSDIRAGTLANVYEHQGKRQHKLIDKMLAYASHITVESRYYIDYLRNKAHYKGPIDYFPNLVECTNLVYTPRKADKINIFYFGRITTLKGIDTILATIKLLDDHYHLYLAGGIAPDIDKTTLDNPKITYLGVLTSLQLKSEMKRMHIFFFPTRYPGEGQSNSLIEAMSQGLIPVTADQGFCKEVVGECGKVLPKGSSPNQYKAVIEEIAEGDLKAQGQQCIEHIKQCHNVDVEIPKLINIYKSL